MTYRLIIKREARLEMLDAYEYYEQKQTGLGDRFLSELEKRFASLSKHPEYYSFIDGKKILRDVAVDNFPFVIVYDVIGMEVNVYAIHLTYKRP